MAVAKEAWRSRLRQRVTGTNAYAQVIRRLSPDLLTIARSANAVGQVRVSNVDFGADVLVFFPDDATKLYQLEQWLPVLERVTEHRLVVMTRSLGTFNALQDQTKLSVVYVRRLRDLNDVLQTNNFKVCLYTNNSALNFQLLSWSRALHIHLNHGESDKISMVSNQAKAYDRIFVAGEAAVLRHRAALMNFDESKLVRIGRPQLDLTFKPSLPPSSRRTLLYAPTWEGENEPNNYTSVDRYGPAITSALLAQDDVRVVYKPHPRVPTSKAAAMLDAHETICRLITDAARRQPDAGHVIAEDSTNVLALLRQADLLISDVSSVTLDYLYLRNECPLLLTDRRSDRRRLLVDAPVSAACDVVEESTVPVLPHLLSAALHDDSYRAQRQQMRQFYFGDVQPGESTTRFLDEVATLIRLRDDGLRARGTLDVRGATTFAIDDGNMDEHMEETR